MRTWTSLALVIAGCSSTPVPTCEISPSVAFVDCPGGARDEWAAFCSGGFDPDHYGKRTEGWTYPTCTGDRGVECADGSTPTCQRNPWYEVEQRYLQCFDADHDGTVSAAEGPSYFPPPPVVGCVSPADGVPPHAECVEDFTSYVPADSGGFACSSSDDPADHQGLFVVCDAPNTPARCERVSGAPLPSDLAMPGCMLPPPLAVARCPEGR
jgi:hypothetical protein